MMQLTEYLMEHPWNINALTFQAHFQPPWHVSAFGMHFTVTVLHSSLQGR